MAGPYTGGWKARAAGMYTDAPAPLGHPEYAEYHDSPDHLEPGSRPPYASPRLQPAPPTMEDPGTSYDQVMPSQAPGIVLDHEPLTHEGEGGAGGGQSLRQAQAAGNAARSRDQGADARQLYMPTPYRSHGQTETTDALTVSPISEGSRIAALRGANSLPENNPEGYRYGVRIQRWVNRRIWLRQRRHDLRPLAPQVAAAAVDSPAMEDGGNRYTSPYSWGASSRKRKANTPEQRRTPRDWSEDITTDGYADDMQPAQFAHPDYQSWGL